MKTLMYDKEDYYKALSLIAPKPMLIKMITNRFPIQNVVEAYEYVEKHPDEVIKVLLEIN